MPRMLSETLRRQPGLLAALLLGFAPVVLAQGGTLRIGQMSLEQDQYVIPIVLSGGEDQVSAMNFRLQYDPAVFQPMAAESGSAAQEAGKVVTANSPAPGDYVVVMMGLNQTAVQQGEVARVVMRQLSTPESGRSEIAIAEPTLANASGMEIPSRGMSRTLDFAEAQSDDGEEQESPEEPAEEEDLPGEPDPETPDGTEAPESPDSGGAGGQPEASPGTSPTANRPMAALGAGPGDARRSAQAPRDAEDEALRSRLAATAAEATALRESLPVPGVPAQEASTGTHPKIVEIPPSGGLTDAVDSGTIGDGSAVEGDEFRVAAAANGSSSGQPAAFTLKAGTKPEQQGWMVTSTLLGGLAVMVVVIASVGVLVVRYWRTG